jgi:hypothetical protein
MSRDKEGTSSSVGAPVTARMVVAAARMQAITVMPETVGTPAIVGRPAKRRY